MRISIHACVKLILPLAFFALLCTGLHAQISTGTVRGTVTDQQGASVPGASVKVTNVDTNFAVTAISNAQGIYTVSDLPVGHYQVDASHEGFNASRTTFELTVGKQQVVDFALNVGTVAQTVTVSADVPQVETTDNSIGWLTDQQQIENLPLNGRNLAQLILLAPGVQPVPQENTEEASTVVPFGFGSPQRFSVAGARPQGQLFLLDGTDTAGVWGNGSGLNLAGTSLGVDGVEEFQTLTDTYTAKYGGNGAAVNAVERSGTNDLHGSAFEYNRNNVLSARNYFETSSSPLPLNRNQFGGTIGGPIRKDSTFFFVNYEQLNQVATTNETTDVPDSNFRMGILPCTQVAGAPSCNPGMPYNVPVGVAPSIAAILASYPVPNGPELLQAGGPTGVAENISDLSQPVHEHYGLAKITQVLSQNDTLDLSYLIDDGQLTLFANPTITDHDTQRNQYATIEERKILSPNLLNVAHLGYARSKIVVATDPNPTYDIIAGSTFNGTFVVPGLSTIGGEDNSTEALNRYTARDQVNFTHGRHSFEAGMEVVYHQINANIPIGNGGDVAYEDLQNFGVPLTSFEALLSNFPLLFAGAPPDMADSTRDIRHWNYSPYVQDKFQWTPKLTINLGLRYDFETNPTETHNKLYNIVNPSIPGTSFVQVPHAFQNNPTRYNFEPRVGFAWDPTPNHKTSIRGGFGVFDDLPLEMQVAISYLFNPPIYNIEEILFPQIPNPFQNGMATGLPSAAQLTAYQTNHDPYIMQYNLTVQQDLGHRTVATIAYIGSKADHLFIGDETNACNPTGINAAGYYERDYGIGGCTAAQTPNPSLGSIVDRFPVGQSNYNSLEVALDKGVGRYAEFRTGYTWSKCLDVGSYYTGNDSIGPDGQTFGVIAGSLENAYRNGDYGPCDFDLRNNWFGNALINLPFAGNRLKEGWQLTAISSAHSGSPYSVYDGFDQAEVGASGAANNAERPDLVPGTKNGNPTSITHSGGNVFGYNTSAFVLQQEGVFGNLGRNTLYSPAYTDVDLGLMKATRVSERTNLQIRVDAFNALNHTNFSYPNAQLYTGPIYNASGQVVGANPNPAAGIISSTNGYNRIMQLSAKFLF